MRDSLDHNLLCGQRQVHEAILIILAIGLGFILGGDTTTSTRDKVGCGLQAVHAFQVVHLLAVSVTRNKHVDAVLLGKPLPSLTAPEALRRVVRHYDLPVGLGCGELRFNPSDLRIPELPEPLRAVVRRDRPHDAAGRSHRRVVELRADVVGGIRVLIPGVPDICVHIEVVDGEVVVVHLDAVVLRRRQPPVGGLGRWGRQPGVADGLVPAGREHESTVVVVS
mmetsp:Transcript_41983/g.89437  ORF Transcript_41983/g.89437 Transcript_41983/m.89437 type:complete len:223 (+) Transcript_41983:423-1091(+)